MLGADMTTLTISVKSPGGKPVEGASVIVKFVKGHSLTKLGKKIRKEWELRTNQEGLVKIPPIPQGTILVQIIAKDYQTFGAELRRGRGAEDDRYQAESAAAAIFSALMLAQAGSRVAVRSASRRSHQSPRRHRAAVWPPARWIARADSSRSSAHRSGSSARNRPCPSGTP